MKILFIHTIQNCYSWKKPISDYYCMHLGISYISSVLKKEGYQTELLVLSEFYGKRNQSSIKKTLDNYNPDLICITAVTSEYPFVTEVAKYIKDNYPDIYLIAGGSHVSVQPEKVINDSFDAICVGEGEYPVLELCKQLENKQIPSGIQNLWIKNKNNNLVEKNPTRPFIQNLDSLPFPDRKMWFKWFHVNPEQQSLSDIVIMLGRGCPYLCTYCSNHVFKNLAEGEYVRYRSPENIIEEIKQLKQEFPTLDKIFFEVESITPNQLWLKDFCAKLKEYNDSIDNSLSYRVNFRVTPNIDYDSMFKMLSDCNFNFINVGLESGSEKVRKEILKRNYSNEDILLAVETARKYNIKICFFVLVGIPGETMDDYQETVDFVRQCQPDMLWHSIFFPYPGTVLYDKCKEMGLLTDKINCKNERFRATLDLPEFSKAKIQKAFLLTYYRVYKGYKPLINIIIVTLHQWSSLYPPLFILKLFIKGTFSKVIRR